MSQQTYRPSASLILAARQSHVTNSSGQDYNYKLLLIKRSPGTRFTKDHCVFPGGGFDGEADETKEWLSYFRDVGVTESQLSALTVRSNKRPSPLMTSGRTYSRDLSLRLTAIRETFEEVGLLLCRKRDELKYVPAAGQPAHVHFMKDCERARWQEAVHNDGRQFLYVCKFFNVVPDLWALSEWSMWRSPRTQIKRYDTVYYFAALDTQPASLSLEQTEVQAAFWQDPLTCLKQFSTEAIWLPSLLFYEITRFAHQRNLSDLASYAHERGQDGSTLLLPVYYRCDDAMIGTLPGDSLYPAYPEACTEITILPCSLSTLRRSSSRTHRFIIYDMHAIAVTTNIPAWHKYLRLLRPATNQVSKL